MRLTRGLYENNVYGHSKMNKYSVCLKKEFIRKCTRAQIFLYEQSLIYS